MTQLKSVRDHSFTVPSPDDVARTYVQNTPCEEVEHKHMMLG